MRRFRRYELIEEEPCFFRETSIVSPRTLTLPSFIHEDLDVGFALDFFNPCPLPSPFDFEAYDVVTDLVRIDRTPSFRRVRRVERVLGTEVYLQSLCDRVTELESRFDRLVKSKRINGGDRKYTWTAEIKGPEDEGFDKKYKWVAEIVEEEKKKKKEEEKKCVIAKNFKWTAEIKGNGEDSGSSRKYTFQVESGDFGKKKESEKESEKEKDKKEKKDKKDKKKKNELRIVEIEEPSDEGAVVLRQVW